MKMCIRDRATVDMVKALNPDIIVNATGSVPTLPPITGLRDLVDKDGTNVATVLAPKYKTWALRIYVFS